MVRASLLVIQGVDQGRRLDLAQNRIRCGRGTQNDLRILDTEVSRRHATLVREGDGYAVEDANSSNGTFVNGQAIVRHTLQNGDQIQIGRTVLLFTSGSAPADAEHIASRIALSAPDEAADRSQIIAEVDSKASASFAAQVTAGISSDPQGRSLEALYRIGEEAVRPSIAIDEILQRILDLTLATIGADRGCMLVADSRTDKITPRVISHSPGVNLDERMPISTSIVEYVINSGQAVRTSDAQHDDRFETGQSILQAGIREAMCVPMQGRYELLGVIYVDTTAASGDWLSGKAPPHQFSDELLTLMLAIGRQSALAVENNRYQQALVTAERLAAVGQTIAILSHHIKNILQGLRGGSYLVDSGLADEDPTMVRRGWGIVQRNQQRIYDLVMDMLTYGKERRPELGSADLNSVVGEVCELMHGRCAESHVTLEAHLAEDLPEAWIDSEGIHRAVLNIVTNAVDVLEEQQSGTIEVTTAYDEESRSFVVEVADDGPGIPAEEKDRLFNLFESTKGSRGTGLGLAVSQKILREHDGEISVESEPGQGTRFRLSWPQHEDERHRIDSVSEMDSLDN